ncbi:MAG TPA: NUDIX hydrolase [Arenicellales bacterium]|jgi:ADP-ribose pyrophosphatase YjhB (NUDIX family)|nr:NUDIX hydrolase [Arenicellales bacterium]HCF73920.1 NUDIX hydrolase [Gammaproteobacteria bacterium]HJP08646.1 NUDIX hydrolase [Arenicellales bacterium]|tara:strand:- start:2604 stop:3149 length:546 start_codon:yes stop_codon:yes gene_type:complete
MNFCSHCGKSVSLKIPEDDNRPRHVCDNCGNIHYQNPKIVAGCIPEWQGKILLCRRAIEPRYGLWTIPAGYMENGETLEQAACRETEEEACARVDLDGLYAVYNIPHVSQVYTIFRGQLADGAFAPGAESLETALFEENQIPWGEIAFPVVDRTLKRFFLDRPEQRFATFVDTVAPPARRR